MMPFYVEKRGGKVAPEDDDEVPAINWRLTFKSQYERHRYDSFKQRATSLCGLFVFLVFTLVIVAFFSVYMLARPANTAFYDAYIPIIIVGDASLLPGFLLVYKLYSPSSLTKIKATTLGSTFILMLTLAINAVVVLRTAVGKCPTSSDPFSQVSCNPEHEVHFLPQDVTLTSILILAILQVLVKCHRFSVLVAAWCITFATVVSCVLIFDAHNSFCIPVLTLLMFCLLYENERFIMQTFVVIQGQQNTVRATLRVESEKNAVQQQAEEMKHLLGNVAHDLKTPMQGFVVGLESLGLVLKKCIGVDGLTMVYSKLQIDDAKNTLLSLNDTSRFMFMTIHRALDFSRVAAGLELVPKMETVQVEEAVKWAIECVNSVKEKVQVVCEPTPVAICKHVITDKMWLVENLLCLISNAVKFTTEGQVVVRCSLREAMLRFEVEDNGIGISKSQRGELFRPYRQAQRFAGGTGLGLFSLAKRVEALHGSCGVEDRLDRQSGSRFWFEVDYRPDDSMLQTASRLSSDKVLVTRQSFMTTKYDERVAIFQSMSQESAGDTNTISDLNSASVTYPDNISVLLVEDSLMVQKVTSKALSNVGWNMDVADNGDIGLCKMKNKKYGLVLMDLQMPVMDGLEAVRRLREYELEMGIAKNGRQVIIGVSAKSDSVAETSCLSVGMDGFIPKPFTVRQLVDFCTKAGIAL